MKIGVISLKGSYLGSVDGFLSSRDWDLPENDEKRKLGALWEMRSNGKGLFIMPRGRDFEEIWKKVRKG